MKYDTERIEKGSGRQKRLAWVAGGAGALAFGLYLTGLANAFVNWDDVDYVTQNPHLGRLDLEFLSWAFTTWFSNNWHPLTWISIGIDHAIWGRESATGYHLTSALLHAANSFLVTILTHRLLRRAGASDASGVPAAALVGVLFACHPLHVESVAWVSERKDVLFALFYLLGLLAHLSYTAGLQARRTGAYLLTIVCFALSVASKPMAVSLPIVLLILDAYPLGRLRPGRLWRIGMLEKLPFYVIGLGSSWVTLAAQRAGGALGAIELPLFERLLLAERAVGFYLWKLVAPVGLVPLYPLPSEFSLLGPEFLLAGVAILAITAASIWLRRRAPVLLAAWTFFIVSLLPVLGIVQVGSQAAADRYMYLSMLGPLVVVGALGVAAWNLGANTRKAFYGGALAVTVLFSSLTLSQIGVFRDSVTLWRHVIARFPDATTAHHNLGIGYQSAGDLVRAELAWERALELDPRHKWASTELGNLAGSRGDLRSAERHYRIAVATDPNYAAPRFNLAQTLEKLGRLQEADQHYRIFVQIAPPQYAEIAEQVRARLQGQ